MAVKDALDESTVRFLLENSPDGHFILADRRFRFLNAAGRRMFGLRADQVEGLPVEDVVHASEVERIRANLALRERGVLHGSNTYLAQRRDGATFPIEVHAEIASFGGKPTVHGTIRDVTNRRKMEERLGRLERSSLIARLSAGLAHDFNNILAVILTNTDVAAKDARDAAVQAAITRIRHAVQRGSDKLKQVQQMSGVHAPTEELRPLYVNPIVEQVLELTEARWRDEAESAGVRYDVRWEPGEPAPVRAVAGELRDALVAVVFNAIEAMPKGGTLTIRSGRTQDGQTLLTVRDSGEGILDTNLSKLTDPFFTTRNDRQMGLGLHLVQQVLDRHEGRMEIDSVPGAGTTVAILLPPSPDAPAEPPPQPRTETGRNVAPAPAPVSAARPRTRGARSVLLIDDQSDLVQVLQGTLEARGFAVDSAYNGRDGIALAEANRYSVVLTDLGMPDVSGWEVSQRIREVQPKTPVVLITGWAADIDESRLAAHGIKALLPKPFRTEQLLQLLDKVLKGE